jgi:hypothetical protein
VAQILLNFGKVRLGGSLMFYPYKENIVAPNLRNWRTSIIFGSLNLAWSAQCPLELASSSGLDCDAESAAFPKTDKDCVKLA